MQTPLQAQRIAKVLDIPLLAVTATTIGFSLVIIRSASMVYSSSIILVTKQALGLMIGTAGLIGMTIADYRTIAGASRWIYLGNILLLLLVLVIGREAKGAQRWIPLGPFNLQPSEIAKLAVIITLSRYLAGLGDQIRSFSGLAKSLLHIALPTLLIFKQPDMGTSLVLVSLWFGLTYMAGAKVRHLFLCLLGGLLLFGVLWCTGEIKPYQKARLISCFNPDADPRGSGYHIRQS
ncbi:MAG: FtsW/RodA/SpoVE family cell cycle protein, partial [Armatimonadota bacterium]